jgi:16S rRNA (guanine527-N7)-methyltransferase
VTDDYASAGIELIGASALIEPRLRKYVELLAHWRIITNLISKKGFSQVWTRHVADCAQLVGFAPLARQWIDLGSGAGFPGVIIAIMLTEVDGARVHCVESDQRKCAFLREVARATGAPIHVHAARIEILDFSAFPPADAVTSRALASLPTLVEFATASLMNGSVGIFPQGRSGATQFEALSVTSKFQIESFPSKLDPEARIVRIRSRAPAQK